MKARRHISALAMAVLLSACAAGKAQRQPGVGKLTVGVTTTGASGIPSTFRVTVTSAGISGNIKSDAGVFISDNVPPGEHVVRLEVPGNCRVDNGPERTITISPQRRSAVLRFEVRCS